MSDKWKKFSEEQPSDAPLTDDTSDAVEEAAPSLNFPDQEQFAALEQKVAELTEKNLRLLAQFKNTQERAERDVSNAHKYGSEKLVADLLPILDSLRRGLETTTDDDGEGGGSGVLRHGMKLTLELFENMLKKHGVTVIAPVSGDRFNPDQHEAMSMQAGSGLEANTVIQTIQPGYSLNGRVLRAAMVVVAAP